METNLKLEPMLERLDGTLTRLVFDKATTHGELLKISRRFLLNWRYYEGLVSRDLLLKSASTFGSFQVLFSFVVEYFTFVIEDKLANTPESPE